MWMILRGMHNTSFFEIRMVLANFLYAPSQSQVAFYFWQVFAVLCNATNHVIIKVQGGFYQAED